MYFIHRFTDVMIQFRACSYISSRIDNLVFDENESKVLAVLDWELSTLGDPVTDLALNCLPYYLSPKFPILKGTG